MGSFYFTLDSWTTIFIIMARDTTPKLLFSCLTVLSCFFPYCTCSTSLLKQNGRLVKGMFVFGSSLVDNGNNNFLHNSKAKADYFPYGMDFSYGPSGRFTNGKNVIDLLGEQLKLPLIPAFADPSTKESRIVHGVDYASGASGILDDTGFVAGQVISLSKQIWNFRKVTLPELEAQMGNKNSQLLANYLFVVGTGGNDYSFNYFLRRPNANVSLEAFTANLTISLFRKLKELYHLGTRKFVLMSVNPIGCIPAVKANRPTHTGCIQSLNRAARLFNVQLKSLVDAFGKQMPGSNIVFVNAYKIIRDIIKSPLSKGFKDASNPCCEVLPINGGGNGISCREQGQTCDDRSIYVFFDGLHPTEAVNVEIAAKAFNSTLQVYVYPINVQQLAEL